MFAGFATRLRNQLHNQQADWCVGLELTINSYGDNFGQHEAIAANERGDLAQWVEFEIGFGDALVRICLDEFDVEGVLFCYCEERCGAGVTLWLRSADFFFK